MTNTNNMIKSPIFYMGNKYDLLYNLLMYFPREEDVNLFIDLFGGSGVVSVNVPYKNVVYNEINHNVTELLRLFQNYKGEELVNHIKKRIDEYDMPNESMDVRQPTYDNVKFDKAQKSYLKFRKDYNKSNKDYRDLFVLIHFSFCNLMRFNSKSEFNMPFGNRCFLYDEHAHNIISFHKVINDKQIVFQDQDALQYLESIKSNQGQFIYLDPPYLNTMAIYNESRAFGGWNIEHDYKMFSELDRLNDLGIKWAMSNVLVNKGKENNHLKEWAIKNNYTIIDFENKQYSALGKGNAKSQEVLIINYKAPFEQFTIFNFMEDGGKK